MASSPELVELRRAQMAHARQARLTQQRTKKRAEHLAWITSASDTLPPFTDSQKAVLAALLRGSGGDAA